MLNRFENCKSLVDLYNVFATEEGVQDYNALSSDELDRVALVFETNIPNKVEMPDVPLTQAGYTYIWNVTVEEIETTSNENMEEETMNNTTTVKGNVEAAVEEMMSKINQAKANVFEKAGETGEEYINRVDDSLNVMKGALGNVIDTLDTVLGYSMIKNSILAIMEAGTDGKTSKKDLFEMAKECRNLIDAEIEELIEFGDEEDFKKAVQLKALNEGCRGKSIFEAFVSGCIWVARTVSDRIKGWAKNKMDNEKSIIGAICRSIAGFANVLRAGVKIVFNAVKFAVSFVIAGTIKIADYIVRAIKSVVSKIKDWNTKKDEVITEEEVQEVTEEDLEEEFNDEMI